MNELLPHFHVQPVLSELYHSRDLLDFSGPSTPPQPTQSPSTSTSSPSLFQSATSIAAAASRRAAAAAAATAGTSSPSGQSSTPPSSGPKEIRCVEGYEKNVYIGASDGTVEWWTCDGGPSTSATNGWTMKNRHTLFPRRPVSRMYILPKISKILIVSDGTLHALGLPNLEPLPSSHVPPLRGVISVILDDEELDWGGPGTEDPNDQMTVVLVRRKGLGVYKLGNRMTSVKEIPLPAPPTQHALFASYLCTSIPSTTPDQSPLYSLIDLSDASLTEVLPVTQIDPEVAEFEVNPNIVVIPGENEFLVTSYTGSTTMGVFLNGQGDPVRGTMEWTSHPLSIAVESGFIIALLKDHSIVVHALTDLDKPAQVIALDPAVGAFSLTYSPYGVAVRDLVRDERMAVSHLKLLGGKLVPSKPIETKTPAPDPGASDLPPAGEPPLSPEAERGQESSPPLEDPPSGSGLTPPSSPRPAPVTPQRGSSLPSALGPFSTAVAETLIVGPHSVQSLTPTPVILRLEALCAERRLDEAISLVDEERRRGRRGEIDVDKSTHQSTMRLVHLYLAAHLFQEAMFDKATDYWNRGKADPRILVRCFTDLRGKLIGSEEEVESYAGLRDVLENMSSVEEIILSSIKRNYSPHVQPNSATAPETSVLRTAMMDEARDMLAECLRKTRTSRRKGGGARGVDSRKIDIVIDTTLAKLLADKGTTNELLALLAAPNDVVLTELEPFLSKRPYVLVTVMRTEGRVDRVLELLKEMAESDTPDPDPICEDPIEELAQQLESVKDPKLFLEYLLWLVEKRPSRGLAILLAQNPKTGIKLDDSSLIESLRRINGEIADRYLEHAVVGRRSPNRALHEQLLGVLLDEAEELARDDGVRYHLEELDAEYRLEREPRPFPLFLAHIAPDTPIKRTRLRLMLFLQGSPFYDLANAADRLEKIDRLKYELAVVYGRLAKHRAALSLLAVVIGDSISAQTYCNTKGEIVPPKIARGVSARVPGLDGWATLGEVGRKRTEVGEGEMRALVKELLAVYMSDSKGTSKQAAALLNAQSVHLDVLEVLGQMPNDWPLDEVSSFLKRSIRRGLHDKSTWAVLKAISAGQNLEVSEEYLDKIRQMPPTIVNDDGAKGYDQGQGVDDSFEVGEKLSLAGLGFSAPYEGSIAEKEWGSYHEKQASESESGSGVGVGVGVGSEKSGNDEGGNKEGRESEGYELRTSHVGHDSETLV